VVKAGHPVDGVPGSDLQRVEELASLADGGRLDRLLGGLPVAQRDAVRARVLDERSSTRDPSALCEGYVDEPGEVAAALATLGRPALRLERGGARPAGATTRDPGSAGAPRPGPTFG
jgi:hypothetical protein